MALTFYTDVKIPEQEIINYIAEGTPENIAKFVTKIITDPYNKDIDEYCSLLMMADWTKKLSKQTKYECPELSKKYFELNKILNELFTFNE